MKEEILVTTAVSIALAFVAAWFLWGRPMRISERMSDAAKEDLRQAEKAIHLANANALERANHVELEHHAAIRQAKASAFEEGRQLGLVQSQRDQILEVSRLRDEFSHHIASAREEATNEARNRLRAEYELQTKLFAVKIAPYVKIVEDRSIFNKKHELVSGYQYQLLINGIPAFQPHVVPERIEVKSEVNPELEKLFLDTAKMAAQAAIDLYLGSNSQFARLAPEVVERITK